MDIWDKKQSVLCRECGSEASVVYPSFFRKWLKRVQYCPFCGHGFDKPTQMERPLFTFKENPDE